MSAAIETEFREIDESGNWNAIYQEIRQQSSELPSKIAKLPENKARNRYRDVSPFDHSRIRLLLGSNDYINASSILVEEAQRSYILTQGRSSEERHVLDYAEELACIWEKVKLVVTTKMWGLFNLIFGNAWLSFIYINIF